MTASWRAAGLLLLPALSGCLQVQYVSRVVDQPPAAGLLQQLQPGQDDLGSCLRRLGAPRYVWEYAGDGAALGWVYGDSAGWGVSGSYSITDFANVSFEFDSDDLQLPGVVLWFGPDLRLLRWQQGLLGQLTSGLRRPAPVEAPGG